MQLTAIRAKSQLDPLLQDIRERYRAALSAKYGQADGRGFYSESDWRRIGFAPDLIAPGTRSILDVGSGPGVLLNYLVASGRYEKVVGVDKRRYSKFVALVPGVDVEIGDVTGLTYRDREFDTVFCMEVLEHLTLAQLRKALKELRRVTAKRLIMTVPFEEPLPLPAFHKQRFDLETLRAAFPTAEISLLQKAARAAAWHWALIIENYD